MAAFSNNDTSWPTRVTPYDNDTSNYYSTDSTTRSINITPTSTSSTAYWNNWRQPERFLVKRPKHWKKRQVLAVMRLINVETNSGYRIRLVSKDEKVPDDIEIKTMEVALFKVRAKCNKRDKLKIDSFIKKYPPKLNKKW